jgi:hypothetical protein
MKSKIKKFKHCAKNEIEESVLSHLDTYRGKQGLYIIKPKNIEVLKKICLKLGYEQKSEIAYVGKSGLTKNTDLFKRPKQEMGWQNFTGATFVKKIGKYLDFDINDDRNKILQQNTRKFILDNFYIECEILEKNIDVILAETEMIKALEPCLNNKHNFDKMSDSDAKIFIDDVFNEIKKSKTIEDIERIYIKTEILPKNMMKDDLYPKINYSISRDEISELQKNNILNNNLTFTNDLSNEQDNSVIKLLYSIIWKNGDLLKVKHIIQGILESEIENVDNHDKEFVEKQDSLVFYQFGKYLTKKNNEPIIDQHVVRAFAVSRDGRKINLDRKISTPLKGADHIDLISKYKEWLISDELTKELKQIPEYNYYIDKLLFAAGKSIKLKK